MEASMLVVIDESGCPGFKQGSSTHYVLGMVIFERFSDAEDTARVIHRLKQRISARREFHFSQCHNRKRDEFFKAIKDCKFKVRIFVVEKRLIYSTELKSSKVKFTNYFLQKFINSDFNGLIDAIIKIDGKKKKIFEKTFKSYVRGQTSNRNIKDIKFVNSEGDVLVQLADMIVSAYSRPYNNPAAKDAFHWRNKIEHKIVNVWKFQ